MAPSAPSAERLTSLVPTARQPGAAVGASATAPPKHAAKSTGMPALKILSPSTQHGAPALLALGLRAKPAASPAPSGRGEAPRSGAAGRQPSLLWFRADLRLHDHEALTRACAESTSVLPVYVFDPRDFGASAAGFERTGPARAAFLTECVGALRAALRARGSDLLVRVGRPEAVLPQLARAVGAAAVFAHAEVSAEERARERLVADALDAAGAPLRCLWGGTLHHLEDLPFRVADMPANYGAFRAAVAGAPVRAALPVPTTLPRLPLGAPEPGDLPTLAQLGVRGAPPPPPPGAAPIMRGGEAEALRRLRAFASATGGGAAAADGDGMYGAGFSCKISPWLALGCLSPRRLYEELRAAHGSSSGGSAAVAQPAAASATAASGARAADTNLNWLVFELVWRDFFRFVTLKYSRDALKAATPALAAAKSGAT